MLYVMILSIKLIPTNEYINDEILATLEFIVNVLVILFLENFKHIYKRIQNSCIDKQYFGTKNLD